MVGDKRAAGAAEALLVDAVPDAEHEVVDEQLRAAVEELRERLRPFARFERVLLLDRHPGQLAAPARELVPSARMLLLCDEQLPACGQPVVSCSHGVLGHCVSPSVVCRCHTIVSLMANDTFTA